MPRNTFFANAIGLVTGAVLASRRPGRVMFGTLAFGRGFVAGRLKPHDSRRGR